MALWCFYSGVVAALFVLILQTHIPVSDGANILGLFTGLSPSHLLIHLSMAETLADNGHNVTIVTSVEAANGVPDNVNHIMIPVDEDTRDGFKALVRSTTQRKHNIFSFIGLLKNPNVSLGGQYRLMLDKRFTSLYDEKFDLVIIGYFMNMFQLGVAAKFNCPFIINWVGAPFDMSNQLIGNPSDVSIMHQPAASITFSERFQSFLLHMGNRFLIFQLEREMEKYYNKLYANERNFPTYWEMRQRISLMFSNYHQISEGPIRPMVPAIIEVGGLQIKEQPARLPKDLGEFLDNAKSGAILLSLGTNVQGAYLKPSVTTAIFNTLSQLKQRIVWKWENLNDTPGQAANILYRQWVPQDDILAHPNIKLFITHAGKGGVAEAQYHGIPMVALPFYGDQPGHALLIVQKGYGLALNFANLTENVFSSTVREVLENPKYSNHIKKFSNLYRDRPLTARETVKYWTDYVLRHKGAFHMQSLLLQLNFIQTYNIDIYFVIFLIVYILWLIMKFIVRLLYRRFCQSSYTKSIKIKKYQ